MNPFPRHAAVIMDGNGRWAEQHNLPRVSGHEAGAAAVEKIIKAAASSGLEYLTLYAFSTENWKRSTEEVSALMELLAEFLLTKLELLQQHNIKLLIAGRIDGMPETVQAPLYNAIEATSGNTALTLIIALNYGGRGEITDAFRSLAEKISSGTISVNDITEDLVSSYLYNPGVPDPELIVRTSGESRLSNFLLWQSAYSEIIIIPELWPDFDETTFNRVIDIYRNRDRRFGGRPDETAGSKTQC